MKQFIINLFAVCICFGQVLRLSAQSTEKEVNTKLIEAVISPANAQEIREMQTELKVGVNLIKIRQLSPYLDEKTIQIKADNDLVIQSIQFQLGSIAEPKQLDSLKMIRVKILELEKKIQEEKTGVQVISDRKAFLVANYAVSKAENVKPEVFTTMNDIISVKIKALAYELLERNNKIEAYDKEIINNDELIYKISKRSNKTKGEIILKVVSAKDYLAKFTLSYITDKAGWTPSYDIKVGKLDKPLELYYKANVFQETGNDWSNIKMRFTNTAPAEFGNVPELGTYYLPLPTEDDNYRRAAAEHRAQKTMVNHKLITGTVREVNGDPVIGASVIIHGTSIFTSTNENGYFAINNVPIGAVLDFHYLGYVTRNINIDQTTDYIIVNLMEDVVALNEVVATGYGTMGSGNQTQSNANETDRDRSSLFEKTLKGRVSGLAVQGSPGGDISVNIRGTSTLNTESITYNVNASKGTAENFIEFVVTKPTTLASSSKIESIDLQKFDIPVLYTYTVIPKKEPVAFLNALILDWSKFNLLKGEANIYLDNTLMGKTMLDVNNFNDTLTLSLGKDRNVIAKREKMKEFSKNTFLGATRNTSLQYKIAIRNNKQEEISIKVLDQFPISTIEQINVYDVESAGGVHNKENGKIEWNIKIPAQSTKELNLKYSVKFPKVGLLFVD